LLGDAPGYLDSMSNRAAGSTSGGAPLTAAALAVIAVAMTRVTSPDDDTPPASAPAGSPGTPATSKSGVLGRIDLAQQRSRPLSFLVGVVKKFGDDRAGRLAALVAYYGFFSLFPAMLAMVTILGFVLDGRDDLRRRIANSALAQFPVVGESIGSSVSSPLSGNTIALVVGLAGAIWAGLGAMQAAQDAMNEVWGVPRTEYPSFLKKRLRSVGTVVVIVIGLASSTLITQLALNVVGGVFASIVLFLATVAIDVLMFLVAFRILTVVRLRWHQLLPGAVVGGIGYAVLQLAGTAYVTRTLAGADKTYGTFATVIGLLSWIYLIAQLTMVAAEVNVVASRKLWPRSLFADTATPADQRAVETVAEGARIAPDENVEVSFDPEPVRDVSREPSAAAPTGIA
jgi:inner membrane protein YhjD